jgi:hypothetical protein
MISKPLIYMAAIGTIGVLAVAWWLGNAPARVTIANQSGHAIREATISSGDARVVVGELLNGESRTVRIRAGGQVAMAFRTPGGPHRWESRVELSPGLPTILEIAPDDSVRLRSRLRELKR